MVTYVAPHPNSSAVLARLWPLNRDALLRGLAALYQKDAASIARVLDVCQVGAEWRVRTAGAVVLHACGCCLRLLPAAAAAAAACCPRCLLLAPRSSRSGRRAVLCLARRVPACPRTPLSTPHPAAARPACRSSRA